MRKITEEIICHHHGVFNFYCHENTFLVWLKTDLTHQLAV